ncbi:DMT family transporter [Breoghania sp.]|uniref:DMT family transporter n=1 Tax=Breoghania sp. TaxID=2065378 RepID=UPI0029C9F622|nr:DMT family transporter [Breoghania sp.]
MPDTSPPSDAPSPANDPHCEPPQGTGQADQAGKRAKRLRAWWETLPGNTRGAIWILVACFFFTIMTALIKVVGQRIHVSQILLARQIVMTFIVAPTILSSFPDSLRTARPGLHLSRILLASGAMILGFSAVIHLPLADATAISFAKSFFVTIFAIIILKETVGIHRWSAVILGFIGVVIMLDPTGSGLQNVYGLMAVGGAACAGMVMILIRQMSKTDRPVTILTYQACGVGLLMIIPSWIYWVTPTWTEVALMLAIGCIAWIAQMCNIQAFKAGEATAIASLDYTRLLYATVFGLILFGSLPGMNTLVGAGIIIAASLYTVHREAQLNKRFVRAPEGRGYNN